MKILVAALMGILLACGFHSHAHAAISQEQGLVTAACGVTPTYLDGTFGYLALDIHGVPCGSSGGGGGGAVTGALNSFVDGWDITKGAKADAACLTDNGTCSLIALYKRNNQNQTTLIAAVNGPIPSQASSVSIGGVGVLTTTAGGTTPFHLLTTASNNSTLVSTGAHTLYSLVITGTNTTIGDVRIYDSSGAPTCSSATGVVLNFPVITTTGQMGGVVVPIPAQGIALANGLGYCATGANADNDNTNAPTGINVNGSYK